jgi:hypothetical protein
MAINNRKKSHIALPGRKTLFLGVLVALLAAGAVHIVHGSSTKSSGHQRSSRPHVAVHCARNHVAAHCRRPHHTLRTSHRRAVRIHRHRAAPRPSPLHQYAVQLLPIVNRSRAVFDQSSFSSASAGLGDLDGVCGQYGVKVNILTEQVDGVPHPQAWYGPDSVLHRRVLGVYHDMQGALLNCVNAADNGDGQAASLAINDIRHAAAHLRNLDDRLKALSLRP